MATPYDATIEALKKALERAGSASLDKQAAVIEIQKEMEKVSSDTNWRQGWSPTDQKNKLSNLQKQLSAAQISINQAKQVQSEYETALGKAQDSSTAFATDPKNAQAQMDLEERQKNGGLTAAEKASIDIRVKESDQSYDIAKGRLKLEQASNDLRNRIETGNLDIAKTRTGIEQQNANTAEYTSKVNAQNMSAQQDIARLKLQLDQKQISLEEYKARATEVYNRQQVALKTLSEENAIRTSQFSGAVQQRGQDIQEAASRRGFVQDSGDQTLKLLQIITSHGKGRMSLDQFFALRDRMFGQGRAQAESIGGLKDYPREQMPSTDPTTREVAGSAGLPGYDKSGKPIGSSPPESNTNASGNTNLDMFSQFVKETGSTDYNEYVKWAKEHGVEAGPNAVTQEQLDQRDAMRSSGDASTPTPAPVTNPSTSTPPAQSVTPPESNTNNLVEPQGPVTPVIQPTSSGNPVSDPNTFASSLMIPPRAEQGNAPNSQGSAVGGITINVGQPQGPVVPQVPTTPVPQEQDIHSQAKDYDVDQTAKHTLLTDAQDLGFDPEVVQHLQQKWGVNQDFTSPFKDFIQKQRNQPQPIA